MKKLIIGKDGQIGSSLQNAYTNDPNVNFIGRRELDLKNHNDIWQTLEKFRPSVIINAAAYTQVDKAEVEKSAALSINTEAVEIMAKYASDRRCLLVHYSSDYVFNGEKKTAYVETDAAQPLSVYGMTKSKSENVIKNANCPFLIFRTSWVFSLKDENFPNKILRAASTNNSLKVVNDQIGNPTSANLIASITKLCVKKYKITQNNSFDGVYHLSSSGGVNWHEFAKYLVNGATKRGLTLACKADQIHPTTSSDYPRAAKRPRNSLLNCDKIRSVFGVDLPSWQEDTDRFLDARVIS